MSDLQKEVFEIAKSRAMELEELYEHPGEENEDGEPYDLYSWIDDQLDIEVRASLHKSYQSCEITITCGGPTVWLDTASREVVCHWGCDQASFPVHKEVCEAIDDIVREYWEVA